MGATYQRAGSGGAVYADRPFTGWPNVKADGKSDDSGVINDLFGRLKTTGGGKVILPAGKKVRLEKTVTIPAGCQLEVPPSTILDLTGMKDKVGIVVNDHDAHPILGTGQLVGPGQNTDTTAISVTGWGLKLRLDKITGFGIGLDLAHSDTYIVAVDGGAIGDCGTCVNLDLDAAKASNAGERIVFDRVTFFNSKHAIRATGNGMDAYFVGCSVDYCSDFGYVDGGYLRYVACHFETGGDYAKSNSGYGWTAHANGHISFASCTWVFSGTPLIVNPNEGPWNYNAGRVTFDPTCSAWFQAPDGNSQTRHSADLIRVDGTYTGYSPFLTKWGPASVQVATNDGNPQADVSARITAADTWTGKFTVTTTGPAWVRVNW